MYDHNDRRRDGHRNHHSGSGNHAQGGPGRGRGLPLSELDPALTAVSHTVIGCARDVHMALGPGYDAPVYQEALKVEMDAAGVTYKVGHVFPVNYKGRVIGQVVTNVFIADRFLVQVMAQPGDVSANDRALLRAQLKAGGLELGLIINFAGRLLKDGLVRVLNPDKIPALKSAMDGQAEADGSAQDGDGLHDSMR